MEPVLPSSPKPVASQPAAPTQSTGIVGWFGSKIIGMATAHEGASLRDRKIDLSTKECGKVLQDISKQITSNLVAELKSSFVTGGQAHLQQTIEDMLGEVFAKFAVRGVQNPELLTDEELTDHFLASIIGIMQKEFASEKETKAHFKSIADELLVTAFPQRLKDPHLPKALRDILSDSGTYSWARYYDSRLKAFNWDSLVTLFSNYLEQIYNCLQKPPVQLLDQSHLPGGKELAEAIVAKLEVASTEASLADTKIPMLNNESNAFVKRFLNRLLHQKIHSESDKKVLTDARAWLLATMRQSIEAVLATILLPMDKETPKEYRERLIEKLLTKARPALSSMMSQVRTINVESKEKIEARVDAALKKLELAPFHTVLKKAKDAKEINEARSLLCQCESYLVVAKLLIQEVDLARLKKLLPQFLTVERVLEQLNSLLSPYVLEIASQCVDITKQAEECREGLKGDGGDEIAGWIDRMVKVASGTLEIKAQAHSMTPTGFQFLDEMICHALKKSSNEAVIEEKKYIDSEIKDIVTVVVFKAIQSHRKKGEKASETLALLANSVLDKSREVVDLLIQKKKSGEKVDEKNYFIEQAQKILSQIIPEERLNSLLPPFLRGFKLWDTAADYLATYLKGVYVQTERSERSFEPLKVKELASLRDEAVKTLKIKFQEAAKGKGIMASLLKGKTIETLALKALPQIVEAILAFHLNPTRAIKSEVRAADLALKMMGIMQMGFTFADEYAKSKDKDAWLDDHGITREQLEAFRKSQDLETLTSDDIKTYFLHLATIELMQVILPPELEKQLIPEEFASFGIDKQIGSLIFGYLKQAYGYTQNIAAFGGKESLKGLDSFVQEKLQSFATAKKKGVGTWQDKFLAELLSHKGEGQEALIQKFTQNAVFAVFGFFTANATSKGTNLLELVSPLMQRMQETFHVLNEPKSNGKGKLAKLKIEAADIKEYFKVTGKDAKEQDHNQIAYYVSGKRALYDLFSDAEWAALFPEFMGPIITREAVAAFTCSLSKLVHDVQKVLQTRAEHGKRLSGELKANDYVDAKVVGEIRTAIREVGDKKEPLASTLPPVLDALMKQALGDQKTAFGDIRDLLVERFVYSLMDVLFTSKETIVTRIVEFVRVFQTGNDFAASETLLKLLLPAELFELPLADVVLKETVLPEVTTKCIEVRQSIDRLNQMGSQAKTYLDGLPGTQELMRDVMKSLDETIDSLPDQKQPLSDTLPKAFDDQLKLMLKNGALRPLAKQAMKSIVLILFQQLLTPDAGESYEEHVMKVAATLLNDFNSANLEKTGNQWLKILIKDDTLNELLPEFLRGVVTTEKLVSWIFLPYVQQVQKTVQQVARESVIPISQDTQKLQNYLKKYLLAAKGPTATKRGLSGYEGIVSQIEKYLLGTLDDKDSKVGATLSTYLDVTCKQVTEALEKQGFLDKNFLAGGLISSCPSLDSTHPDKDFNKNAAQLLLKKIFPEGVNSLLVPDVVKETVWNKVTKAIEELLADLTTSDRRLLFTIKRLIPQTTSDPKEIGKRLQEVEDLKTTDPHFAKTAENLVKKYTREAAIHQVDIQIQNSKMWGPFKWLARQAVKVVTSLIMRFSMQNSVYNFLKDEHTDGKMRAFIWSFVNYTPQPQTATDETLKKELKDKVTAALTTTKLASWPLQSAIASGTAGYIVGKNFLDFL